jgi:hypothetical protein
VLLIAEGVPITYLNEAVSGMLLCFECGFEDFGRGRTAGMEMVWEGFGERMGRWRKRERRLVWVNGDLRHTSSGTARDRTGTTASGDRNGERTAGHEVSSAGIRW